MKEQDIGYLEGIYSLLTEEYGERKHFLPRLKQIIDSERADLAAKCESATTAAELPVREFKNLEDIKYPGGYYPAGTTFTDTLWATCLNMFFQF